MVDFNNSERNLFLTPVNFKNAERPFTEIFALLRPQKARRGKRTHYDVDTLHAIYKHTTNTVSSLIWGLESLGYILAIASASGEVGYDYASGSGFFVKSSANLLEALCHLRSYLEQELKGSDSKVSKIAPKKQD